MCNLHVSIAKLIRFFDFNYLPTRFESNFAVNVMETYAMTELMVPLLEKNLRQELLQFCLAECILRLSREICRYLVSVIILSIF